nr:type II toxin-antitoxin system RelE/ParE family toxin [uncultured Enterobacter sp.]
MKIQYTRTVAICINDIASHLRQGGVNPQPILAAAIEAFETTVGTFPEGCHICPQLLMLGVARYREFNSENGYRVLYSFDDDIITAHAVLAQRQDIKQLLFKRLIEA